MNSEISNQFVEFFLIVDDIAVCARYINIDRFNSFLVGLHFWSKLPNHVMDKIAYKICNNDFFLVGEI